ncbi:MAG: Cytidine deaminase [candidate division WS2 bacterium]|uniref:Cytidine deaminase n=1 Tax=Psychracetigena formicireducens TaxID=2986056 RepID=A0A9E2BJE9_PSYF1|nr:Cytidine deaminase [Candidatus Psychracetigena formicireducens]MBT9144189.1 Cytidine deaminase [Candidatus Psychracetigena formicireducens]MBT9149971.1 Cytidine deaminase [Candidatus Psychracetigena formicireducens]
MKINDKYSHLVEEARKTKLNAYAPYSRYQVGAALLTRNGEIYTGVNVENSSFGLTVCAERIAIFNALSQGNQDLEAIAISAQGEEIPYPCGACRQVMNEFNPDLMVILDSGDHINIYSLQELFPMAFKLKR